MKTEKLLEDLEVLIESSSRIPMTTKRMVEEDEIMRIIDSIQESLPLELEESRRIVADKDKVLLECALGGLSNNIFASTYTCYIPNKEQLISEVEKVLKDNKD